MEAAVVRFPPLPFSLNFFSKTSPPPRGPPLPQGGCCPPPPGGHKRPPTRRWSSPPHASSCRTSPASPASSTSPRCATRSATSAATRAASTRSSRSDLVIDHSVQVDQFGTPSAFAFNARLGDRSATASATSSCAGARTAFDNFRVVPPDTGIVHQVNLEYLAQCRVREAGGRRDGGVPRHAGRHRLAHDDDQRARRARLGRRRHRGRGGDARPADADAHAPEVVGFKLTGALPEGATATDLVLTVTRCCARRASSASSSSSTAAASSLPLADRATIANMAPEYGATMGFFPVDAETLDYLRFTGRPEPLASSSRPTAKAQGLFRDRRHARAGLHRHAATSTSRRRAEPGRPQAPAGPRRSPTRKRMAARKSRRSSTAAEGRRPQRLSNWAPTAAVNGRPATRPPYVAERSMARIRTHGTARSSSRRSPAAPTPRTRTRDARRRPAREEGRRARPRDKPWVKTSLAPGFEGRHRLPDEAGLRTRLDALGFNLVGYGCTTCIGNSGPLPRADHRRDPRRQPRRGVGALGQPQLRGTHPARR